MAANQFDPAAPAVKLFGQQFNQRLVCRGVYGRRGDLDSQLVAKRLTNLIDGRAREQFYRQQCPVRLRTQKSGKREMAMRLHEFY